jgi:hypothetical protein
VQIALEKPPMHLVVADGQSAQTELARG